MSEGLEEKLSFIRRVHQNEIGFFVDAVSRYSGYLINPLLDDRGVILCDGEKVPFNFEISKGFVGLNFRFNPSDVAHIKLRNSIRQAIVKYFTEGAGSRTFSIPFNVPLSDNYVHHFFTSLRSELKINVALDGKTRLLMKNGRMVVGGSLSRKPNVLAFKCSYENSLCRMLELHAPALTESLLDFYKQIEGFVDNYHPPQRL